jgi:hypothetical protein
MKTERRHELEANELAQRLEKVVVRVKPYSSTILTVIAVGLILWAAYSYLQQRNRAGATEAWYVFHQAANIEAPDVNALKLIVTEYEGAPVANWSRLMIADFSLAQGLEALFNDRSEATKQFETAEENYQGILQSSREEYLIDRAHLGLGRLNESRNELDQAREQYNLIAARSPFHAYAQERIKDLETNPTKDFYDWFAEQNPKPLSSPVNPLLEGTSGLGLPDIGLPPEGAPDSSQPLFPEPILQPGGSNTGDSSGQGDAASPTPSPPDEGASTSSETPQAESATSGQSPEAPSADSANETSSDSSGSGELP